MIAAIIGSRSRSDQVAEMLLLVRILIKLTFQGRSCTLNIIEAYLSFKAYPAVNVKE